MRFLESCNEWITGHRAAWIIIASAFLIYFNSLFNGFVWDDEEQIVANTLIHGFSGLNQVLTGATFNTGGGELSGWFFRPMITLTFMVNWIVWQGNPFGFHLFQVIFHAANGVLLFLILNFLSSKSKSPYLHLINTLLSVIFVIHPAITEGVVYISAVSEVMYTFLILLSFLLLLRSGLRNPPAKLLVLTASLLYIAALYKEPALAGPVLISAYMLINKHKHLLKWLATMITTMAAYFITRLLIAGTPIQHPQFAPISEASLTERLLTIPAVFVHYLHLIVFPDNLAISRHFVVTNPTTGNFYAPLAVILSLLILTGLFAVKTGSKTAVLGIVWSILTFGIISNLFPLDMTVAERWLYFPLIGLIILAGAMLDRLSKFRPTLGMAVIIVLMLSILPLGLRTIIRNTNWTDGYTLYSHDAAVNPESFDLQNNLGVELFRLGRIDEAKIHFEKSLQLQPEWVYTINNLGAVYQNKKDFRKAEELYLKVLERSDYYRSHENLSTIYTMTGRYREAAEFTGNSLLKLPENPVLWRNLAVSDYRLGNQEEALRAAEIYYRLSPSNESAYLYMKIEKKEDLVLE